jgi:hypothetical protein
MRAASIILALVILSAAACTSTRPARVILVFVDVSASVKDVAVYRDAWLKIVSTLHPGDRLILARISDRTYTAFRPVLDCELPRFSYWRDNTLLHEARMKALHDTFAASLEESLKGARSRRTDVLGAFSAAEIVLKGDRRQGRLVLLSDMLEDSEAYNFEKAEITEEFGRRILAAASRERRLPDLGGAMVYVAGASAGNNSKAWEVERFWLAYAKAANADLSRERYGPALMNFAE